MKKNQHLTQTSKVEEEEAAADGSSSQEMTP